MDFKFLQNPLSHKWVVLAPRRASRPDEAKGSISFCPFCLGQEKNEKEVYRIGGEEGDSNWQVRVVPNKYPFAPIHEVIIHSPDHHKNFEELPNLQVELILKTYRQRFQTHKDKGQVYIFHNHGEKSGESLPHPHTQLTVIPDDVTLDIMRLAIGDELDKVTEDQVVHETDFFQLFCPRSSQWPDEVWIHPKKGGAFYSDITDKEITNLAFVLKRLIQIFGLRHGNEFPYNFYIYPGKDWYLRLIPRDKGLGGFEIGTGIYVNTQDPSETIDFIKKHFEMGSESEISRADYGKSA
ncbi:MAG: hypothetical protein HYU48_00060 [Candidatus Levybacteria bacterium]|nr:hypothetical protein [Candidatus Levybacteria bacterium]